LQDWFPCIFSGLQGIGNTALFERPVYDKLRHEHPQPTFRHFGDDASKISELPGYFFFQPFVSRDKIEEEFIDERFRNAAVAIADGFYFL
jgi:hypothetical protein